MHLPNSRERRVTEDGSEADGHDQDNNAAPPDAEDHRTEEGGEGQVDVADGNREGSAQSAPEEESSQSNEVYCELLIQNKLIFLMQTISLISGSTHATRHVGPRTRGPPRIVSIRSGARCPLRFDHSRNFVF